MPRDEREPHSFDQFDSSYDELYAEPVARRLRVEREHGIITIPGDARYLALGAGQAHAELAIAKGLGIKPERVTLLDMEFSPAARARFSRINFPGQIVEDGALHYLEAQQAPMFDLVTAIGMEHRFSDQEAHERLVRSLAVSLHEGGVALVEMGFMGWSNFTSVWKKHGFESIFTERLSAPSSYFMVLRHPPVGK